MLIKKVFSPIKISEIVQSSLIPICIIALILCSLKLSIADQALNTMANTCEKSKHSIADTEKSFDTALKSCCLGKPDGLFQHLSNTALCKREILAICDCFHPNRESFTKFFKDNKDVFLSLVDAFMTHREWFENPRSGWTVAMILERVGEEDVVEPLLELLQDNDPDARVEAARALGNTGDRMLSRHLVPLLLGDDQDFVRREAALALERLEWEPEDESQAIKYYIARWEWDEVRRFGSAAVEPLLTFMKICDWHRKWAVVTILGELGDERAVPALIPYLRNEFDELTLVVIEALGMLGDIRAVEPLENIIDSGDERLSQTAWEALTRYKTKMKEMRHHEKDREECRIRGYKQD